MEPDVNARIDAQTFAQQWASNWNRKDVEAVLSHFSENVIFTSAKAKAVVGYGRVEGKFRLREYWNSAIGRIQTIHFNLDHVISDGDRIGIVYTAEIDGKRARAVEFLRFGNDGLVCEGEAMYGVEL